MFIRAGLHCMRLGALIGLIFAGASVAACANTVPPLKGNDTGGIIAWSPATHDYRHQIAAEHCGFYRKLHRIRTVTPRYGEYIAFECRFPRETDEVVLRRAY